MSPGVLTRVSLQLRRNDLSQLFAGYMILLAFVLVITWPEPPAANNSWYALAQTRLVALLLLALQGGARARKEPRQERLAGLLALHAFLLFSLPVDIASYAASYPSVPWLWSMAVTWVDLLAFFTLGFLVAGFLGRFAQGILLAAALLLVFVASFFADLLIGRQIFHPLVALTSVSPLHLGLMTAIAALGARRLFGPAGNRNDAEGDA